MNLVGIHPLLSSKTPVNTLRLISDTTLDFLHSSKLWGVLAVLVLAIGASTGVVAAQGREAPVLILDVTQGNYGVVVRVLPRVPAVGPINFTISPTAASDRSPVQDADITLVAHDVEGMPVYQVKALNTPANQDEYVGNLVIKADGAWSIHVEIDSEELGSEVFIARISVAPAAVEATPEAGWLMVLVMVAFVAGGVFIWLSSRRALARRAGSRPTS